MVITDKLPRNKLCKDLIGPQESHIQNNVKTIVTKPNISEGLYNAQQSNGNSQT